MAVQRASVAPHGLGAVLASSRTCYPAPTYEGGDASPYRQTALAIPCQHSTLWEDYLQRLENQLNPAVFFDRQQRNNFRASRNDDCDSSSSCRVHA